MDLIPAKEVSFGELLYAANKQGIIFHVDREILFALYGKTHGHRIFDLKA